MCGGDGDGDGCNVEAVEKNIRVSEKKKNDDHISTSI